MTDKLKPGDGKSIQKPWFPDQTRGQSASSAPQKPKVPVPPPQITKPKK